MGFISISSLLSHRAAPVFRSISMVKRRGAVSRAPPHLPPCFSRTVTVATVLVASSKIRVEQDSSAREKRRRWAMMRKAVCRMAFFLGRENHEGDKAGEERDKCSH